MRRALTAAVFVAMLAVAIVASQAQVQVSRAFGVASVTQNNPAAGPFTSITSSSIEVAHTVGGVDETLAASPSWTAFRFTATAAAMGSVAIQLKRDAGVTAGTVRMFLYTDTGGSGPGADRSDTSTGLPIIVDVRGLSTTYSFLEFRLPQNSLNNANNAGCSAPCGPLTVGTTYWAVINAQGITGGNVYLERQSAGTGLFATAADSSGAPGTWTVVNSKDAAYLVYGDSGPSITGTTQNRDGILGVGNAGFGGRFVSVEGTGVKADSTDSYGVGGTSIYSNGVRASSNFGVALSAVAAGNYGATLQGTTGGAQTDCTSAGCTSIQAITGSGGIVLQGLSNSFAVTSQIDGAGNISAVHFYGNLGTAPTIASGFGTSPSIASGHDGAFTVNVGTGGTATSGVVNFGSTWATTPICLVLDNTTPAHNANISNSTTTTAITVSTTSAWAASDVLKVMCEGS